jgi:TonB-linked SusC/RagA family outer membrane protein
MEKLYQKLSMLSLLLTWITVGAVAQDNVVSGKVTDSRTTEPMSGVTVIVKGTTFGTVTDIEGKFTLQIKDNPATLVFSFIGYRTKEVQASAGSSNIEVVIEEDATNLEEVVVTGLASSVKRSNLANAVASVSSAELTQVANAQTLDGALNGKFKGASISSNSGSPGGGMSFRLRGITSLSGFNQPLIIMDGVYLDNSSISPGLNTVSRAAGGGSQSNQDNPSNRLADINPEDIENVEILKGASASAIYGSRASGGVIIITTKKGKEGKPQVTFSQAVGVTTMLNPLGVRQWNDQKVQAAWGPAEVPVYQAAVNAGNIFNYEDELYGNKGLLINTNLSIVGGSDQTKYFIGATRKDDEGIIENTGYKKNSFRLNIDQKITKFVDLSLNTNYIHSSADRGYFNNDNTATTMGVSFAGTPSWAYLFPDAQGNYPNNPYSGANFLQTRDLITNNEKVDRFVGGGSATAKLLTRDNHGLKLIVQGGLDSYTLATTAIFPNTLQFQKNGNGLNGVSIEGTTQNRNTNISAFLVHDFFPTGSAFNFRTQFGITQLDFYQNTVLVTASNMNGSQTNVDQSGSQAVDQNRLIQQDKGFFVQEEVNFGDKILATVGLRGDKSSNNGDVNKLYYYPKANVAFNIHQFSFWKLESINQLKLRAAYGEAGNFAAFGSKYTSLTPSVIDGIPGNEINPAQGNDELGPERQKEFEFGFDLGLLNNRVSLDFTHYTKTVENMLLAARAPSSSGFTTQLTNAADMQNQGIEIGVDGVVISNKDLNWNTRVSWWKNKGEVTRLDIPSFTTGGFADFIGMFRIKEGHSPTEIIGVGPNPDEDGYVVYGNSEPDFQMNFFNSVTWKGFEFSMLWHWKKGGDNVNLTTLLSDLSSNSFDFDDTGLDPEGIMPNGPYRLSNIGVNTDPMVEDASYVRMREIGLYYNFPKAWVQGFAEGIKVGFSGNNLINFFDYNSYDPEVSNFGGAGLSTGIDVNPFPSSKRMNFHVIFKF